MIDSLRWSFDSHCKLRLASLWHNMLSTGQIPIRNIYSRHCVEWSIDKSSKTIAQTVQTWTLLRTLSVKWSKSEETVNRIGQKTKSTATNLKWTAKVHQIHDFRQLAVILSNEFNRLNCKHFAVIYWPMHFITVENALPQQLIYYRVSFLKVACQINIC